MGLQLHPAVWSAVALGGILGWLWPTQRHRALLSLGRSLQLGERLAALEAQVEQGTPGLAGLLAADVAQRPWALWRLATGRWEVATLVAGIVVLGATWLPFGEGTPALEGEPPPSAQAVSAPDEEEGVPAAPVDAVVPRVTDSQEHTTGYSPYTDLLAAVLGLEAAGELWGDPEALAATLAQQEGLLRELSERLSELASPDIDGIPAAAITSLADQVSRDDLREIVRRAASSEHADTWATAQQAVDAVLEGRPLHDGDAPQPDERQEDPGTPLAAPSDTLAEQRPSGEGDGEPKDAASRHVGMTDLPEGVEEISNGDGLADGLPGTAGTLPDKAAPEAGGPPGRGHVDPSTPNGHALGELEVDGDLTRVAVRSDDGAWRTYLVVDVPTESPGEREGAIELTPHEVDLLLRARSIPPELRDVVRRYFENVTREAGGVH